ncbi:MAG: ABC transporter ATP-binding protein [Thermodesulfovibrionales bacterium]
MRILEAVRIEKSFYTQAGELKVLKGVDLYIEEGEMVSIVGASGAGKSTLLHILGAIDRPTSGKVIYEGIDIFSRNNGFLTRFRNETVGFVFQFHHLLPEFTALENVMMPGMIARETLRIDTEDIVDRAERLLSDLGLYERRNHRPGELSGGEQQRVAVARALIMNPRVVLADEPTGNLDTATGEDLFNLLIKLNKDRGIAFVIVTHNESLSKRCNRTLRMVDGRIST